MTLINNTGDNESENFHIILDDTKLERVNKTKFLGVIIDENLTWKYHIDGITKIISRNIGMMNKLKFFVPERILRTLYCSLEKLSVSFEKVYNSMIGNIISFYRIFVLCNLDVWFRNYGKSCEVPPNLFGLIH